MWNIGVMEWWSDGRMEFGVVVECHSVVISRRLDEILKFWNNGGLWR